MVVKRNERADRQRVMANPNAFFSYANMKKCIKNERFTVLALRWKVRRSVVSHCDDNGHSTNGVSSVLKGSYPLHSWHSHRMIIRKVDKKLQPQRPPIGATKCKGRECFCLSNVLQHSNDDGRTNATFCRCRCHEWKLNLFSSVLSLFDRQDRWAFVVKPSM